MVEARAIASFIGVVGQALGTLLVFVLFWRLWPRASRRVYFQHWTYAWGSYALALVILLPYLAADIGLIQGFEPGSAVRTLSFSLYHVGKIGFLLFLTHGVVFFVGGFETRPFMRAATFAGLVMAGLSLWFSEDLLNSTIWQTVLVVGVMSYSASLLLRLPNTASSGATRTLAAVLILDALLWLAYLIGVYMTVNDQASSLVAALLFNSTLDLLVALMIGGAMLLVLFEDIGRESAAAHAELAIAYQELERDAYLDPLTGCLNRRAFEEGRGLESAAMSYGAIALLDVDALKPINDDHGHSAGDSVLRHVAENLRRAIRPADRLYRIGGDEFVVIMPRATADSGERRLRAIVEAIPLFHLSEGEHLPLRVSVGVAIYRSAEDMEQALGEADALMYANKEQARTGTTRPTSTRR